MKNKTGYFMLILRAIVVGMLTALVIYNTFKGDYLWAILQLQMLTMYIVIDDKREKLELELWDIEYKQLMAKSQIQTLNAVKSLVEKDTEKAKAVVEEMPKKRRGRKSKSE